jgi:hypothetical protein
VQVQVHEAEENVDGLLKNWRQKALNWRIFFDKNKNVNIFQFFFSVRIFKIFKKYLKNYVAHSNVEEIIELRLQSRRSSVLIPQG